MTGGAGWSDRVPFTLLGGYLGAGKTTLLNRLLASVADRRIAVLVNDVGAVNVDAALIADHDGATLTLTNGCVCCALGDDLVLTLEQVRSLNPRPDQVVMELSGVAEPARVASWANTTGFRLDGIVVMADAEQIVELASRRYVGDTIRAQLAAADLVLLGKSDLVHDPADAVAFVTTVTDAPVHDAREVDPVIAFGVGDGRAPIDTRDTEDHPEHHPEHHAVSAVDASALTRRRLAALVDELGPDVVRAKGLVRCTDVEAPVEVHVVGRRRELRVRVDLPSEAATDVLVVVAVPTSG
jgi:G3E family GTPase